MPLALELRIPSTHRAKLGTPAGVLAPHRSASAFPSRATQSCDFTHAPPHIVPIRASRTSLSRGRPGQAGGGRPIVGAKPSDATLRGPVAGNYLGQATSMGQTHRSRGVCVRGWDGRTSVRETRPSSWLTPARTPPPRVKRHALPHPPGSHMCSYAAQTSGHVLLHFLSSSF